MAKSKKNQKSLPFHTHFIGISIPLNSELENFVFDCRTYMADVYGCKSGHGTPPHITLLSPFAISDEFDDEQVYKTAFEALEECKRQNVFPLKVNIIGFGAFLERTIFINVEDSPQWQKAHEIFTKKLTEKFMLSQKPNKKFYPHLTIANRDIPSGTIDEALKHFGELNLSDSFIADEICVYVRTPTKGWDVGTRIK